MTFSLILPPLRRATFEPKCLPLGMEKNECVPHARCVLGFQKVPAGLFLEVRILNVVAPPLGVSIPGLQWLTFPADPLSGYFKPFIFTSCFELQFILNLCPPRVPPPMSNAQRLDHVDCHCSFIGVHWARPSPLCTAPSNPPPFFRCGHFPGGGCGGGGAAAGHRHGPLPLFSAAAPRPRPRQQAPAPATPGLPAAHAAVSPPPQPVPTQPCSPNRYPATVSYPSTLCRS